MPIEHSAIFQEICDTQAELVVGQPPTAIKSNALVDKIVEGLISYEQLADLLKEVNDSQFGIVSSLSDAGDWVRDATESIPLSERISHESPSIENNNTLLRCLSRLRPIDYAIEQSNPEKAAELRAELKEKLSSLTKNIIDISNELESDDESKLSKINSLEKDFDTFLIKTLHEANLTKGITKPEQAEKLLFHYRNLSSLLTPARPLVTITHDKVGNVYQRETQYPVTKKTQLQKAEIEKLTDINSSPLEQDKTAHTIQREGLQQADALFKDLMLSDKTCLGAQARKTHLVGAKNAFIVKNEMVRAEHIQEHVNFDDAVAAQGKTLWLGRTGSPAYVGKGESSEKLLEHTRENLQQIRLAAQKLTGENLNIHLTTLNTYSFLENQATIINNLYDVTRRDPQNNDEISYAPTNPDGTFRLLDIADNLYEAHDPDKPYGSTPLNKAKRIDSVSNIMLKASEKDGALSLVNCASGQDRTGTAVEKTTQRWMSKCYAELGLETSNIQTMRAEGGNAAEITSHHIHGSPGMKTDSKAGDTFNAEASQQFYRASAKTNKKNPVDNVDFLGTPSKAAISEFLENIDKFKVTIDAYNDEDKPDKSHFKDSGKQVYANIVKIVGRDLNPDTIQQSVDAKTLSHLNSMAATCNHTMNNPGDVLSARKLAGLSKVIPDKGSAVLRTLGKGLLVFACLALITVGILAAIPSGGSSLLLSAIGAAGLTTTTAAIAGASVVATTAVAGSGALHHGRQGELEKSFKDFKSDFNKIKTAENDSNEQETDYKGPKK